MSKPINVVLDATMLDTYQTCACKFNYRFNLNKTTMIKAKPLDRGGIVHIGFENYYQGLKDKLSFNSCVVRGIDAMNFAYAKESDLELKEFNKVIEVFIENTLRWRVIDENELEILAVETPFTYELFSDEFIRIIMIGKIDLLVNYQSYTNLPYDHKSYDRDYPLTRKTNQFCNYAYACNSNYLMVNRVGFQTSIKPEVKHKRSPLSYDPIFLEQWKKNVIIWAYKYLQSASEDEWEMNDTSCMKFNRLCEYLEICESSGIEAKIYKLESQFNTVEKWDVSKVHGESK